MDGLGKLAIGAVVLTIVLTVGFLIVAQANTQIATLDNIDTNNASQCATSVACNATTTLNAAMSTIPDWVGLIIIATIGGLLIGLVAIFKTGGR